ncbi:hypothetical protein [Hyella patelloides]|uniref:hypothetical protein n=1 Tax=Hyella patelloides TaxID=1982969 RepID=UPI0016437207|nr:hypothetical protein [Hyella patelloides]
MKTRVNIQKGDRFGLLMVILAAILWGTIGLVVQAISIKRKNPEIKLLPRSLIIIALLIIEKK